MNTTAAVDALRAVPLLADLPEEGLRWLAGVGQWLDYGPHEVVFSEGQEAAFMVVVLEGGYQVRSSSVAGEVIHEVRAPGVGGFLPFSRMVSFPGTSRTTTRTRTLRVAKSLFPEMLARMPSLEAKIVGTLADRVRDVSRREEQRARLAALGRLSAGLAHELNNPASAAARGAGQLRELIATERTLSAGLYALPQGERAAVEEFRRAGGGRQERLDPLRRADLEDAVTAWLTERGVDEAWSLAPELCNAGLDVAKLETIAATMSPGALTPALAWLAAALAVDAVAAGVEEACGRVSALVDAVKSYTQMDRAPVSELDVHDGLESTLTVLVQKLAGVRLERSYDRSLPRIVGSAAELNQVWTALVDNSLDALQGRGRLLVITRREGDRIAVEVADDGPGISPTIQGRIFEPFFTTKGVGQGLGLGLDLARRIARQHGGDVNLVEAGAAGARFVVTIPVVEAR